MVTGSGVYDRSAGPLITTSAIRNPATRKKRRSHVSSSPLQRFLGVLLRFANEEGDIDERDPDFWIAQALWKEGCVSALDTSNLEGHRLQSVRIAAKGAVVLAEWRLLIERSTVRGRIVANVERVLWALVGALLTMLAQVR